MRPEATSACGLKLLVWRQLFVGFGGAFCPSTQLLRCRYLYYCTSKASKLSTWPRSCLRSRSRRCCREGGFRALPLARLRHLHASAYFSILQHSIRQQPPAYVRMRQHTSALPLARLTHRIPAVILVFVVGPPRLPPRPRIAITRPGRQRRCRRRRRCRLRRRHLSWQSV